MASSFGSDIGEIYGGSVSAPVVEECAKAAALLGVYRWRRRELDGVLDGLVYAAMVGLGFATTENVLYYARAVADEGVPAEAVFFVRGVISPFAHPVFTAMTGLGLGLAAMSPARWRRLAFAATGLLAALFLHSLWNTAAVDGFAFLGVYFLIMVPLFGVLVAIALLARRREARMVWDQLQPEAQRGLLTPSEVAALAGLRPQRRALRAARRAGGATARRHRAAYHETATALAFHRNRARRGVAGRPEQAAREDAALLGRLLELRRGLDPDSRALDAAQPLPHWSPRPMVSGQARMRYWDGQAWTSHTA